MSLGYPSKATPTVSYVAKRLFKYSFVALLATGVTLATAFEGIHLYVEHVGMAPEADPEVKKWEWDAVDNRWSGDSTRGGTDASIGIRARHLIRGAWMAYNWGVGYNTGVIAEEPSGSNGSGMAPTTIIHVVDARLVKTEQLLRSAIELIDADSTHHHSDTLAILLLRRANVLDQLGDRFLLETKKQYERAWNAFAVQGLERAYIAQKLGDVNIRLGHDADALDWWAKSSQLAQGRAHLSGDSSEPLTVPSSPMAQRILFSGLISRSAYFASSGKLKEAEHLEETALELLRSIPPPESMAAASPPQALHALYLLQRSSLLCLHLAEVLHARRRPAISSIQWLTSAAESSERVARGLTDSNSRHPPALETNSSTGISISGTLSPVYASSRSMNKPASALLRDAKRTAAEAWNLLGILYEDRQGPLSRTAFNCFERAVNWAGTTAPGDNDMEAADAILESDWQIYSSNYQRIKNALAKSAQS
ncbi:hypothetical protein B0H34DRAFT_781047 [Crassisporium funariophilum]|nr:hypothetical protein B0H34DRAFT_781047 [Crassisporium funariophilum]